jgi:hypothetical protein
MLRLLLDATTARGVRGYSLYARASASARMALSNFQFAMQARAQS